MVTRKDKKIDYYYNGIDTYTKYTPDQLIEAANKMKEDGITGVEINWEYESLNIDYFRPETEEEATKREDEHQKHIKRLIAIQESDLKESAKRFGYKLIKEEEVA